MQSVKEKGAAEANAQTQLNDITPPYKEQEYNRKKAFVDGLSNLLTNFNPLVEKIEYFKLPYAEVVKISFKHSQPDYINVTYNSLEMIHREVVEEVYMGKAYGEIVNPKSIESIESLIKDIPEEQVSDFDMLSMFQTLIKHCGKKCFNEQFYAANVHENCGKHNIRVIEDPENGDIIGFEYK